MKFQLAFLLFIGIFASLSFADDYVGQSHTTGTGTDAIVGRTAGGQLYERAMQITLTNTQTITRLQLDMLKWGTPTGNVILRIETSASSLPSGILVDSNAWVNISANSTPASHDYVDFNFTTPFQLPAGTYWIVADSNEPAGTNKGANWVYDSAGGGAVNINKAGWSSYSLSHNYKLYYLNTTTIPLYVSMDAPSNISYYYANVPITINCSGGNASYLLNVTDGGTAILADQSVTNGTAFTFSNTTFSAGYHALSAICWNGTNTNNTDRTFTYTIPTVYFLTPTPINNTNNFTAPMVINITAGSDIALSNGYIEVDGTNVTCNAASNTRSCSLNYTSLYFNHTYSLRGFANVSGTYHLANETRSIPYYGCGYIDKNATLLSNINGFPLNFASASYNVSTCLIILNSYTAIDCAGYKLTETGVNSNPTWTDGIGIWMFLNITLKNLTIKNCIFNRSQSSSTYTHDSAINLYNSANITIQNNSFHRFAWGLYLYNNTEMMITNNTFLNNSAGYGTNWIQSAIWIDGSNNFTISNNIILNNSNGIGCDRSASTGCFNSTIINNTIGSSRGSYVAGTGGYGIAGVTPSGNNKIYNNIIYNNSLAGILDFSSTNNTYENNTLYLNGIGFFSNDSNTTILKNNRFYNNSYDLKINSTTTNRLFNSTWNLFDNPAGNSSQMTNISINDTFGVESYFVNWSSNSYSLTGGYVNFWGKFVNISKITGTPSLDLFTWHWTTDELVGHNVSDLSLWKYNGSWVELNDTPDTTNNELSLSAHNPSSLYGVLEASSIVYFTDPTPINNTNNFTHGLIFNISVTSGTFSGDGYIEIDGANKTCSLASDNISCSYALLFNDHIHNNTYDLRGFGNLSGTMTLANETRVIPYYGCGEINKNGSMIGNVIENSTFDFCFNVTVSDLSFDCAGYNITGSDNTSALGFSIVNEPRCTEIEIKNCNLYGMRGGFETLTNNLNITNTTMRNISNTGIDIGANNSRFDLIEVNTNQGTGVSFVVADNIENVTFINSHFYNNSLDFNIEGNVNNLNLSGVSIDNPAGGYTNYSNVSIFDDSISGDQPQISWTTNSSTYPSSYLSFANKILFYDMNFASPSIDSSTFNWLDSELGTAYDENKIRLYSFNKSQVMNNTPDTTLNRISLANINYTGNIALMILNATAYFDSPTPDNASNITSTPIQLNLVSANSSMSSACLFEINGVNVSGTQVGSYNCTYNITPTTTGIIYTVRGFSNYSGDYLQSNETLEFTWYSTSTCVELLNIYNLTQNHSSYAEVGDTMLYLISNITLNNTCPSNITDLEFDIVDGDADSAWIAYPINISPNEVKNFTDFQFRIPINFTYIGDIGSQTVFTKQYDHRYDLNTTYARIINSTNINITALGDTRILYNCEATSCPYTEGTWAGNLDYTFSTTILRIGGILNTALSYVQSYDGAAGGGTLDGYGGGGGGGGIAPSSYTVVSVPGAEETEGAGLEAGISGELTQQRKDLSACGFPLGLLILIIYAAGRRNT